MRGLPRPTAHARPAQADGACAACPSRRRMRGLPTPTAHARSAQADDACAACPEGKVKAGVGEDTQRTLASNEDEQVWPDAGVPEDADEDAPATHLNKSVP